MTLDKGLFFLLCSALFPLFSFLFSPYWELRLLDQLRGLGAGLEG